MFDDFTLFISTAIEWFKMLWNAFGTWGIIGAFIIGNVFLRKLVIFFKYLWKGGL
ncbi:MAG: hypothetical protein NC305_03995 [Lachnospiraceae bacterium]|nr:hypothetical protein [Muribaculaceae bacterium]MCM1409693.1 hypothetical protein [Lachnospiraceae bacterium]